jgi:hypothetical protein
VWKREGDYLYCRPVDAKLGSEPRPSDDAVPRFMDAATAHRIKDEAYNQMCDDLVSAWRK